MLLSKTGGGNLLLALEGGGAVEVFAGGADPVSEAAAQAQATWVIDPTGGTGSDGNSGLPGAPLKSYAELARRWGTTSPRIAQPTTLTFLSDNVASDPVLLTPIVVGAGGFVLSGSLVPLGVVTITVTARNRAAGTPGQVNTPGQVWTPGTTAHDTTAGAQFFVDSDLGGGSARITEPVALPVAQLPTRVALASGDSVALFRPTTLYMQLLDSAGIGTGAGGGLTVRQLAVTADAFCFISPSWNPQECTFNGCLLQTLNSRPNRAVVFSSCWLGTFGGGGTFGGTATFMMGALNGTGNNFQDGSVLDGDVLVNLRAHFAGTLGLAAVYFEQWPTDTGGVQGLGNYWVGPFNSGVQAVWGPATITVSGAQQMLVRSGTAVGALLCTGGLRMNGQSTAYAFNPATGLYSPGPIALTPAAIDSNGAMVNPQYGTRIALA